MSYFKDRKVTLVDGPAVRTITQEKGCPQGSVLGPVLWNVVFGELLEMLGQCEGVNPVAYADDLTMVVGGQTLSQIEHRAQRAMKIVYEWCAASKMKLSQEKTCALVGKGSFRDGTPEIWSDTGIPIPFVTATKYLGISVDRGMKFHTHCQVTADKAKNAFHAYRAIARANWGIQSKQMALLYKAIFVPRIAYGAGAWAKYATRIDLAKLVTAQRAALTTVTRAYRTISTPALLVAAGEAPIEHALQKEYLRYAIRTNQAVEIGGTIFDPTATEAAELVNELGDA